MQSANQEKHKLLRWAKPSRRPSRFWVLFIALLAALFLSGCVHADLEINFRGQSGGEIVQHIKLADQLTAVSSSAAQDWFDGVKRRARQLRGKAKRSDQEIEVAIPFGSPADLEAKVNQLLNPADTKIPSRNVAPGPVTGEASTANPELQLPLVQSHLKVKQQNFLFFLRNRLIYDLDLRSLGVQSANGNLLFSPDPLLELEFKLKTPWLARSVNSKAATSPQVGRQPREATEVRGRGDSRIAPTQHGQQLVWTLQPGQLNHLEAVFWFPSPIGIGAVAIALFIAAGMYVKYRLLPKPSM
jgi:hypothetical protein